MKQPDAQAALTAEFMTYAQADLDEMVTDACVQDALGALNEAENAEQEDVILAAAEERASRINNEGREAQVRFLVRG